MNIAALIEDQQNSFDYFMSLPETEDLREIVGTIGSLVSVLVKDLIVFVAVLLFDVAVAGYDWWVNRRPGQVEMAIAYVNEQYQWWADSWMDEAEWYERWMQPDGGSVEVSAVPVGRVPVGQYLLSQRTSC